MSTAPGTPSAAPVPRASAIGPGPWPPPRSRADWPGRGTRRRSAGWPRRRPRAGRRGIRRTTSGSLSPSRTLRRSTSPAASLPTAPRATAEAIRTSLAGSAIASTSTGRENGALGPRQGDEGGRPERRRRILLPAPDRLELDVPRRLQEHVRPLVLHPVEGLDDGQFGPAELVVLQRVDQEPVEGRLQIPGQVVERVLAGDGAAAATTRFDRSPIRFLSSAFCSSVSDWPRRDRSAASLSSSDSRPAMDGSGGGW